MLAMVWASAFAADCAMKHNDAQVREELAVVESALKTGDPQRFEDGMSRLDQAVDCLGELPGIRTMSRVRLFRGIRDFGTGNTDGAAAEFLASRALDPGVQIPMYPRDHAIYGVFERYDPVRSARERLPAPRRGSLFVDGYETRERFRVAPALVQHAVGDQVVIVAMSPSEAPQYPRRHPVRNALLVTTIGLGVAGGGLIAGSRVPYGRFNKAQGASLGELTKLRSQTNTLSSLGLASLTAAVGTGVLTVVLRER